MTGEEAGITAETPPDAALTAEIAIRKFHEQGFVVLPAVVSSGQARELQELVEQRYRDPATHERPELDLMRGDLSLMRMFEVHRAFADLLLLEPVLGIVEKILGANCHVIAQNALRTPMGKGIINWHIDDALFFPFLAELPEIPRAAGPLPCYSLNAMLALTDVDAVEFGPTQVVAGSQLTGREPGYAAELELDVTPTSLLARAGDVYLVNSQTWHRGAQNQSGRIRYLVTTTYGRRFISQRFYPFLNYRLPPQVLDGASDRLLHLLGRHDKGPYG